MVKLALINTPRSGTFVLGRESQAGLISDHASVLVLQENLQQILAEILNIERASVITTSTPSESENPNALVIEISNIERPMASTHDALKNIADKIGKAAQFLLKEKILVQVYVKPPIILSENVVWKSNP
jgi:hypothetical protein